MAHKISLASYFQIIFFLFCATSSMTRRPRTNQLKTPTPRPPFGSNNPTTFLYYRVSLESLPVACCG